jgi:electron transfer flavoprotein alpha/beta subunit
MELTTWALADLGLDPADVSPLTQVVAADPPPAKPPAQVISGVGPDEAASRVADWLAERKLIA